MRINKIVIEGVDKTGKDLIAKYLMRLCDYKYEIHSRGVISNEVYDILYGREGCERTLDEDTMYVLLDAEKDDLDIRFKITNEKEIKNLNTHRILFKTIFSRMMIDNEHDYHLEFNTSKLTPFMIAKKILRVVEEINEY